MTHRARPRQPAWTRLILAPAVALAAACSPGTGGGSPAAPARAAAAVAPAVTQAEAAQVFGHYTAVRGMAAQAKDSKLLLSVLTGVQRAVVSAPRRAGFTVLTAGGLPDGPSASDSPGAYSSTLTIEVSLAGKTYRHPAFYLPQPAGYPRFFVAQASQALPGLPAGLHLNTVLAETEQPVEGTALMLFEQASSGAPWLLASASELSPGQALPRFAADSSGHIPVVTASAASLAAPLDSVGALQAAAADEGPASPAMRAVAAGPLTTGIYQGAENHTDGLQPPPGDIYQWQLEGTSQPSFALRTASGGALAFYTMTMTETVAVPGIIGKADPIHSGPQIQVPSDIAALLPKDQQAPLQELQSTQQLSFAAVDPARAPGKVQVIAIGGGLTAASAT